MSDCLGPCERSDVVVVSPSPAGKARGGRPTWIGSVLDDGLQDDIAGWVAEGGPGLAKAPRSIQSRTFPKPR